MGKTTISWTQGADGSPGYSANPIRARHKVSGKVGWHCVKHSSGCAQCYAEAINKRFGTGLPFSARSTDDLALGGRMLPYLVTMAGLAIAAAPLIFPDWRPRR